MMPLIAYSVIDKHGIDVVLTEPDLRDQSELKSLPSLSLL
jgi:hypothetical protein